MSTVQVETVIKLTMPIPTGHRPNLLTKAEIEAHITRLLKELPEETVEVVSYTCDGEPVE